jgi:acetylglutamate kinase
MTTVIKLGGSLLEDPQTRATALRAVIDAWNRGESLVLVHGGGKKVDSTLARLGIEKRMHAGLRITDDVTLETVVGVLAGLVNKSLVAELSAAGVRAAGISGIDAGTIVAQPHPPIDGIALGHTGQVTGGDPSLIESLLDRGILPVVASVAQGPNGTLLNVNADSAASAVAVALGAKLITFLTDVPGFLDGAGNVVSKLEEAHAQTLLAAGAVTGGMRPKLEAALAALAGGVSRVVIAGPATHAAALSEGIGGTHLVAA